MSAALEFHCVNVRDEKSVHCRNLRRRSKLQDLVRGSSNVNRESPGALEIVPPSRPLPVATAVTVPEVMLVGSHCDDEEFHPIA